MLDVGGQLRVLGASRKVDPALRSGYARGAELNLHSKLENRELEFQKSVFPIFTVESRRGKYWGNGCMPCWMFVARKLANCGRELHTLRTVIWVA